MVCFHLSLSGCSTGSLETCTHVILMPESQQPWFCPDFNLNYCKGLQTAHQPTHDNISICHCPGAAWGAWKHAPIIPLPRQNALNTACSPCFDNPNTKWLVLSTLSMINVSHLDNLQCLLALPLPLETPMPQHLNTNAITNRILTP